jgi:energy-coupling factor transporter ATP-binding protein EcfA2
LYVKRLVCRNIRGFEAVDLDLCPLYGATKAERRHGLATVEAVDGLLRQFDNSYEPDLFEGDPELKATADELAPFPGWTVITGDNGSGKSTILKSIALALMGPDRARFFHPNYDGWTTKGEGSGSISVEIRPDAQIDKSRAGGRPFKSTFWAELGIQRDEDQPGAPWVLRADNFLKKKSRGAQTGPWQQVPNGWLAVGYGPFRRLYGSSPTAAGVEADPIKARFATLFLEDATLIEAEKWLMELDYATLRGEPEQQAEAQAKLQAVTDLLAADFLRNGMEFMGVSTEGVRLRDPEGRLLNLSEMSEGYRAALAMLIDIVRHIFLAYPDGPSHVRRGPDDFIYLDTPAVVLIDEVDAHLHPAWQREIGDWLKSHFPRIQFIVTTHSPLVCQSADGGRVFVLPAPGEDGEPRRMSPAEYQRVLAGDPAEVLASAAFGLQQTRSDKMVRAMRRHAELQQLELFDKTEIDKSEYRQLELLFEEQFTEPG